MTKIVEITLTEENWLKVDKLILKNQDNDFLKFCLMNDIAKLGLDRLEEQITMNPTSFTITNKIRIAY